MFSKKMGVPGLEVANCNLKFSNSVAVRWRMNSRIGGDTRNPGRQFAL
jgi:hypothetical protein